MSNFLDKIFLVNKDKNLGYAVNLIKAPVVPTVGA